ncbi:pol-polyprotein [Gossypium australe]|uniref:Pol-polyprotein n=1 Tax=Gossypium australe TaxID=47621 RepID=A0A5B6VAY3_9ROSI|nr:pol-polyprotein [Gossypium australe]
MKEEFERFCLVNSGYAKVDPQVIVHKLNFLLEEKAVVEAVRKEIAKLLSAGFIREVECLDWVSNVVMVKKTNGKWRMCINFTNLNKVCLKDSFPLPSVGRFVYASAGHKEIKERWPSSLKRGFFAIRSCLLALRTREQPIRVYVDDMLVKSESIEEYVCILSETFAVLMAHNMKLNLEKCVFGVRRGRSEPGKDQSGHGNVSLVNHEGHTTLYRKSSDTNRLISKMADKCLPFFKAFNTSFSWTTECQAAFEKLKFVLLQQSTLKWRAKVLENRKVHGSQAIVAHLIVVVTNQPMNEILSKVEILGRVTKWDIEQAEFGIDFTSRTMIKLQVLVNFIVECSFEKVVDTVVYVDGSAAKIESGTGALIVDPSGNEWQYRLSLRFQVSNNTIEYKALVSRLQLAGLLGANDLIVHTKSLLVAKQMNGKYDVEKVVLKKYHTIAVQLLAGFDKLSRKDNTCAGSLSKLASFIIIEQRWKILLQHRETPRYDAPQILSIDQEETWITPIVRTLR